MAIDTTNISYKNYLWTKKNEDGTLTGIRLSINNLPTNVVYTDTTQTITGMKTFNAPTNSNGVEQATVKFKTANGGAIIFGKEGSNSGSMIRLDQADGTCRLRFRSSSTPGAMIWEQPESGSAVYMDVAKVHFRGTTGIYFNQYTSAGYLYTDSNGLLKKGTMPTSLKNPNSFILKLNNGTTEGTNLFTYDGSAAKSVNITASNIGAAASNHTHTKSEITDFPTIPTKVSELTNDSGFITSSALPTVNNGTLTLKQGSNTIGTFTANSSSNVSLTIPTGEALLTWGGKNFTSSYGPIDAAMVPELGANRLAFMPANAVTVEYSRDGGATWTDYGATDAQKINLFNGNGSGFTIGKATSGAGNIATNQYQLRVNVYTGVGSVYTALNKFVILVSTNGTNNNWCTIRARTQSNYTNNVDTWVTFADRVTVSGWSGYNVINTSGLTTYGNTATTQYGHVQFIFGCNTGSTNNSHAGLTISKIFGFGGVGWTTPSTMAKNGCMYTYDYNKNVTFPAAVKAKSFEENGTSLANKYLGKTAKASDSDKLAGQNSAYYLDYTNLTNKPSLGTAASKNTGTASGNVPVLDSNGKLVESVIPAVAITDTYVVDTEAEMLALSAQKGDIAIRSDLNKSFVLQATPASTLANWKELLTPTDAVLSVNNKNGAVSLTLDDINDGSTRKLSNYVLKSLTSTKGDMIYASAANTPARLGIGSDGQFLSITNGIPKWVNNPNTHYTMYLQIKGNGTEAVKYTQNANKSLNLKPGNNVSISAVSGEITISATDTNTHNSHIVYSGKKSDGTTDISSGTASSGNITLGDSGVTAGSYGDSANQTPGYGSTFNVPYITVNSKGIVTGLSSHTVKIPASDNTPVVDNLTSTATDQSLSANQGKVLKGLIDGKAAKPTVTTIYNTYTEVGTAPTQNTAISKIFTLTSALVEGDRVKVYVNGGTSGTAAAIQAGIVEFEVFASGSGGVIVGSGSFMSNSGSQIQIISAQVLNSTTLKVSVYGLNAANPATYAKVYLYKVERLRDYV